MKSNININKNRRIFPVISSVVSVCFLLVTGLAITNPANAQSISKKSDIRVDVEAVIALAVANCPDAPSLESTTLTLTLSPVSGGNFKSDCANVGVTTNAPGYSLLARANSDDTTNNLTYQGTTSITPKPNIPPTSASIASPATIAPTHWGFAVENLLNFDTTYIANNANNKYSQMPTTDTLLYKSNEFKTATDIFKFFYGVNVASSTPAGTYLTTVTYTATANDIPLPLTYCGTIDYECIMYTINLPSGGSHKVGTNGVVVDWGWGTHEYDWDIFVNNQPITDCNGSNYCTGAGWDDITITNLPTGEHQIKILPHTEPEPGWGNAFGFYWGDGAVDIVAIDAPLTTMAFAPKPSQSTTSASGIFAYMFGGASNLVTPATFKDTYKLPDTIIYIDNFMCGIHYGNTKLANPIDLSGLSGWLINNNTIIDFDFLYEVHSGNTQLTTPIDLSPLAGWFKNNHSIKYLGVFLGDAHAHNLQLTSPIDLSPLENWFDDSRSFDYINGFLSTTHINNPNLTLSGQKILPDWIKTATSYDSFNNQVPIWNTPAAFDRTFYLLSPQSGDEEEIKFMDGTKLSELGTPTWSNTETYTNRTDIKPVNDNWQ